MAFSSTPATSGYITIQELITFPEYGDGDVIVKVDDGASIAECADGFWLSPNQNGFNSNLSFLLSAFQAGNNVKIHAHTSQLWPGSSGKYCKIYQIYLKR